MPLEQSSGGRRLESWAFATGGRETRAIQYGAMEDGTGALPAAATCLILAPGASAGQDHPGMVALADALAGHGLTVVTFDFPHTAAGKRRPDPAPVGARAWRDALGSVNARGIGSQRLFIGGRSMGGRLATELAASDSTFSSGLSGVVCFGYPLHPPSRSSARSLVHFESIAAPILIVQGTRDAFGGPDDVRAAAPPTSKLTVMAVEQADHGLAVPRRIGRSSADIVAEVAAGVVSWMRKVAPAR
jgi:predicted alpha/beta-hydrolase family hydrolase